jgi:predicted transcriptional regulator of viral defense system
MSMDLFFYSHPVFRHDEFAAWKTQHKPLKAISINTALQHYIKIGRLIGIRRGLFAVVPPDQTPETFSVDAYLIAARVAPDSILAYHTALELHGVAYSFFGVSTFLSRQKNKPFEFNNQWFQAVTHPVALQTANLISVGIQTINRQGMNIQITSLARTYVDILDRIEHSGGWEEVCRAINYISVLDVDEVITYCLMLNNARLAAKVGCFLEQRQGAFKVSDQQLDRLLINKPKNPQYATKRGNDKFQLIKKWNLLMPLSVINQSWEEPNADF